MNYIIKFISGGRTKITELEFRNILRKSGLVAIPSTGEIINMSAIARIVPEINADDLEDNKNKNEGILHDGLPVIRYFGSWFQDGEFDANGRPTRRIDLEYYPEVRADCVPLRKEFEEKYKQLPREERLKLILEVGRTTRVPNLVQTNSIGETIKQIGEKYETK